MSQLNITQLGYNLQQIFEGDVQNPKKGHLPTPEKPSFRLHVSPWSMAKLCGVLDLPALRLWRLRHVLPRQNHQGRHIDRLQNEIQTSNPGPGLSKTCSEMTCEQVFMKEQETRDQKACEDSQMHQSEWAATSKRLLSEKWSPNLINKQNCLLRNLGEKMTGFWI